MSLERINLAILYPPFTSKIQALHKACAARQASYWAISGMRTVAEQDALFAQGRTAPGKVVTNARGGQSYHNFGIAVDFCLDKDTERKGLQPDWDAQAYTVLGEEAVKLGLEWGGNFRSLKDYPHVQLSLQSKATLRDLDREYRKGGYDGVFAFLKAKGL